MKEYVFVLILVGLTVSVATFLSHSTARGATRIALGLLLLCTVVSVVLKFSNDLGNISLPEVNLEDSDLTDGYAEVAQDAFEEGIAVAIMEKFGLDGGVEAVCSGFNISSMRAEEVRVLLSGMSVYIDYRCAAEYVEDNFTDGGRCTVEVFAQ